MNGFLDQAFWGNTVRNWLIAAGIIIGAIALIYIVKQVVIGRLRQWAARTVTTFDNFIISLIERTAVPFFYFMAVYTGLGYLELDARLRQALHVAMLVAGTFFIIRLITSSIAYFINRFIKAHEDQALKRKQSRGILLIVNLVVWAVGLVFLIDNLGYDITAVITGLGIGGIAIALASQAVLGDLFSYFVIFFDKPFEIGDFIIVDDKMGTVEYIGIKTTRIRTLSGEQLVCANTDLTNSRLHNFKRMEKRRVVFTLGVVYDTRTDQLQQIPILVRDIILAQKDTVFDRGHFASFGDFALNFEFVYYIDSPDYNLYMDRQQAIYLAIFQRFTQEGIAFAFPTQTLLLNTPSANGAPRTEAGKPMP